jgi:hypothetical protein
MISRLAVRVVFWWVPPVADLLLGRADKPVSAPSTAPRTPCPAYAGQTGRRAA